MSEQIALERIEIARLENATELDLSGLTLSTLPEEVSHLTSLTDLDLNNNQLTTLSPVMSQLTNLKELYLNSNQLIKLPEVVGQLTNLTILTLTSNQLMTLPEVVGQLINLKTLSIANNKLTALPEVVGQLINLERLYLDSNKLTTLPEVIGQLTNLERLYLDSNKMTILPEVMGRLINLTELWLDKNQLITLPEVFSQLINLRTIRLDNNLLTTLPTVIGQLKNLKRLRLNGNQLTTLSEVAGNLTNLETLWINGNQLTTFPEAIIRLINLQRLRIADNQIITLPKSIDQLNRLTVLDMQGNPLPILPELLAEISKPRVILDYYQRLGRNARQLNEAKLLIVGEADAGKSAIKKRLLGQGFTQEKSPTEGIDIDPWLLPIGDVGETTKVNVWDFGGQEIMHATHQYFLTERCAYVLVLSAVQGEEQNRVHYWLKLLETYGQGAPVIVAINKSDLMRLELDAAGLKQQYPFIVDFVETACSRDDDAGMRRLATLLQTQISQLDGVRLPFPRQYFEVKEQLEQMPDNYIVFESYAERCSKVGLDDERDQRRLLRILHQLGVMLNFDDERVRDTNILKPAWVTRGVYAVVTWKELEAHGGRVRATDLERILDPKLYPRVRQPFILKMMEKFEVCFGVDGPTSEREYLIPDGLPKATPPEVNLDDDQALRFQYRYSVLPGAVLSRFQSRTGPMVHDGQIWRGGVVLGYRNGLNTALVRAEPGASRINVAVHGNANTARDCLAYIRSQFDHIHQSFDKFNVEEWVPVPGQKTAAVNYQTLLNYEQNGMLQIIPDGMSKPVLVRELLNNIGRPAAPEQLAPLMAERMSIDELKSVCFELGVDDEEFDASQKSKFVRQMLQHLQRRDRLQALTDTLRDKWPHVLG